MTRRYLNHRFLMEESEYRIEQASRSDREHERLLADRILESEKQHRSWEASHYQLMKTVAEPTSEEAQVYLLRRTAISLTHRQALFGYLRDKAITGRRRHVLFRAFHGQLDYVNAVIAEHGHFLRAASSTLCATHLGLKIWHETTFDGALAEYEEAYTNYFSVFCDCVIAEAERRDQSTRPLLLYLKAEAACQRVELLAEPCRPGEVAQVRRSRRKRRFGTNGIRLADTHF